MYDPLTLVFEIRSPFKTKPDKLFPKGYKKPLITIWHKDSEKDGTDDACAWYPRSRHGDPKILEKIVNRYKYEWATLFDDKGKPILSTIGTTINLFHFAAFEHFKDKWNYPNHKKIWKFMSKHLYEIILFSENTADSLFNSINPRRNYETKREDKINEFAYIIYGWVLREDRPWWKHPKYHIHHWKIQIHFYDSLRRRLFTRCTFCGKPFINESPFSNQWNTPKIKWFKSEEGLYHEGCLKIINKTNEKTDNKSTKI